MFGECALKKEIKPARFVSPEEVATVEIQHNFSYWFGRGARFVRNMATTERRVSC